MDDSGKFIEKMMELGIGMSMIQQMPAMIDGMMPKPAAPNPAGMPGAVPPPITPAVQVYLAIDNTQAGPFAEEERVKLIQNDLLNSDTLVWKAGMAAWTPASQVPDVNKLFILAKLK